MRTATLIAILFATLGIMGCQGLAKQLGYVDAEEAGAVFANDSYQQALQPSTPATMDQTTPDKPSIVFVNVNICKPLGIVGVAARFECPKPPLPPKAESEPHAEHEPEAEAATPPEPKSEEGGE